MSNAKFSPQFLACLFVFSSILTVSAFATNSGVNQSIRIGDLKVRAVTSTVCLHYVEDSLDGDGWNYGGTCLEQRTTCSYELTFPNNNALGKPQIYEIYRMPFFGLSSADNTDCNALASDWQKQNQNTVLQYSVTENIQSKTGWFYFDIYGDFIHAYEYNGQCYQLQTLSGSAHFSGYDYDLPMQAGEPEFGTGNTNTSIKTRLDGKSCADKN